MHTVHALYTLTLFSCLRKFLQILVYRLSKNSSFYCVEYLRIFREFLDVNVCKAFTGNNCLEYQTISRIAGHRKSLKKISKLTRKFCQNEASNLTRRTLMFFVVHITKSEEVAFVTAICIWTWA